jgi:vacuolar-type H+-ATPase subunit F/Vma7
LVGLLVVLGEASRVEGFALGSASVIAAEDADAVRRAWASLPADVALVVLTYNAAEALESEPAGRQDVLSVVMPR